MVSNEIETANERFDEGIRRADVGDPPVFEFRPGGDILLQDCEIRTERRARS